MNQYSDFEKKAEDLAKEYAGKNQFRTVGNGWNYDELKQAFLDGFKARKMSIEDIKTLTKNLEWWQREESTKCDLILELRDKISVLEKRQMSNNHALNELIKMNVNRILDYD